MWWVRKDIFLEQKMAIFVCAGCESCVMTGEGILFAEVSSAWNRWKQKHKDCEATAEQIAGL